MPICPVVVLLQYESAVESVSWLLKIPFEYITTSYYWAHFALTFREFCKEANKVLYFLQLLNNEQEHLTITKYIKRTKSLILKIICC